MVNWMDPQTILTQSQIFTKILIAVLGFYSWEVIVNLWYDWQIISRKRPFKWPMIVYWVCKYTMFWANIGLTISSNDTAKLNCQSLYLFNQFMGNFAIGSASTLLMLRTIAIYSKNLYVVVPLIVLSLGQWGILFHGISTVEATWQDLPTGGGACVVTAAPQVFLQLLYIYTMSFDLIVLVLSTVGLVFAPGRNRSGLYNLLVRDGLVFFIVAFTSNAVAVVLVLLDLNPVMNVIASVPAAAVSATVACRSFVRLSTYSHSAVVHTSVQRSHANSHTGSGNKMRSKDRNGTSNAIRSEPFAVGGRGPNGVHVQMETFVSRAEESRISFGDVESQTQMEKASYGEESDTYANDRKGRSFMP
ncbi:hypothetical protein FS837_002841 [Tulasnella sp. UAMH 9824]|nr:hypothetical protein FS837_002841 [Tulasnella sp. UAMH 9824]